jgi:hypothetical protein
MISPCVPSGKSILRQLVQKTQPAAFDLIVGAPSLRHGRAVAAHVHHPDRLGHEESPCAAPVDLKRQCWVILCVIEWAAWLADTGVPKFFPNQGGL